MTAIAIVHRDEIIQRMARGEPLTAIAQSLGYADHSGIIHRLDKDEDYKAALRSGIIGKIEKREQELEKAEDNVTVTRADRLLGHARWWAEKLDPARFGKQPDVQIININAAQALDEDVGSLMGKIRSQVGQNRIIEHDASQQDEAEITPTE